MKIDIGTYKQFRSAVLFVAGASSSDKSLPAFTCIKLEIFEDHSIGLVATDRFRLHWAGVGISESQLLQRQAVASVLISARELVQAVKPTKASAYQLDIDIEAGNYAVTVDGVTVAGRLVVADFPKYQQLIPLREGVEVRAGMMTFNPQLLGSTLSAADKHFKNERGVQFHWSGSDGKATFKPVLLLNLSDDDSAGALVMPMRGNK